MIIKRAERRGNNAKKHKFWENRKRAGFYRQKNPSVENIREIACAHLVMTNMSLIYNVPAKMMTHSMRGREKISQCRQCSEYLCHIGFGMTFTKIGTLFKRDDLKSLDDFKNLSNIIIANRSSEKLNDVNTKIFTRDIFGNN